MTRPVKRRETAQGRSKSPRKGQDTRPAPITWQTARCEATPTGWHFVLPTPERTNAIWRQWKGRTLVSAKHRADKQHVLQFRGAPLDGPVVVHVEWVRQRKAGDVDSRIKALLDLLSGVAYTDDAQVCRLAVDRLDDVARAPGCYVWVERLLTRAA